MYTNTFIKTFILALVFVGGFNSHAQLKPAQILSISESPTDYQVYQRDSTDKCTVTIRGKFFGSGPLLIVRKSRYRYNSKYYRINSFPVAIKADSTFEITIRISAELREWGFSLNVGEKSIASFENILCGDVYVVLGQSNATSDLGGPDASYEQNGDTFDSAYANRYARAVGQGIWGLEAAKSEYQWSGWGPASSIYHDFHHAGGWPLKLQHNIINSQNIPVGIINAALSGSSISEHFKDSDPIPGLNNSDGSIIHNNPEEYNARQYLESKLARAAVTNSLKYIFWYQGESDGVFHLCKSHYVDLLNQLIDEWSTEFPTLERVFVFQLNTSCLTGDNSGAYAVREAQRLVCLNNPKATLIPTSGLSVYHMSNDEVTLHSFDNNPCHYNRYGMEFLADRVHTVLRGLIYNNPEITPREVQANNISRATLNKEENKLLLEFMFDVELIDTNDAEMDVDLKEYFYDQDYDPIAISKLEINKNVVTLSLSDTSRLEKISIYPAAFYNHNKRTYYGPWLQTKGSNLGLPFFADVAIDQTRHANPVFNRTWTNSGLGTIGNWVLYPNDLIIGGQFSKSGPSQLLLIDSLGSSALLEYHSPFWENIIANEHLRFPPNLKGIYKGDFDGNGIDEILTLDKNLSLYSIDSTGAPLHWVSDNGLSASLSESTVLTGDFDGSGTTDILLVNTLKKEIRLLSFNRGNDGQYHLNEDRDHPKIAATPLQYSKRFYSGDFNGDGQDELLAFGEGAVLSTLTNGEWSWLWSANLHDHFKGWNYPLDTDNLTLLVGKLDTSHTGDELMIIGANPKETGISVYGFNPETKNWSENETHLSKDPYLGDWPLKAEKGRNTAYTLIPNGKASESLLTFREFECGGVWRYESGLYNLNLNLAPVKHAPSTPDVNFYIYPNPTSTLLHIESELQAYPPTLVKIYNQNGKLIYQYSEPFTPNNFIVDLSSFRSGIYFIELHSKEATETHKLIIIH